MKTSVNIGRLCSRYVVNTARHRDHELQKHWAEPVCFVLETWLGSSFIREEQRKRREKERRYLFTTPLQHPQPLRQTRGEVLAAPPPPGLARPCQAKAEYSWKRKFSNFFIFSHHLSWMMPLSSRININSFRHLKSPLSPCVHRRLLKLF